MQGEGRVPVPGRLRGDGEGDWGGGGEGDVGGERGAALSFEALSGDASVPGVWRGARVAERFVHEACCELWEGEEWGAMSGTVCVDMDFIGWK